MHEFPMQTHKILKDRPKGASFTHSFLSPAPPEGRHCSFLIITRPPPPPTPPNPAIHPYSIAMRRVLKTPLAGVFRARSPLFNRWGNPLVHTYRSAQRARAGRRQVKWTCVRGTEEDGNCASDEGGPAPPPTAYAAHTTVSPRIHNGLLFLMTRTNHGMARSHP
jgi:hypothetical protein